MSRPRAVLDANVYVSALLRPAGPPGRIVERLLRDAAFELVVSPPIAAEVLRVLAYPKLRRYYRAGVDPLLWFEDILVLADFVSGERAIPRLAADPDDDKYIAAALEGRAGFVVTGDAALLAVGVYEDVRVIGPRGFLGVLGP